MFIRAQQTYLALLLAAIMGYAVSVAVGAQAPTRIVPLIGDPASQVYCEAALDALTAADETIDVLLSSVSLDGHPLVDALVSASERHVRIRVLMDASGWAPEITARNRPVLDYLLEQGIEARFDDPAISLHAKLIVVDETVVLLGSSNWNRYALTEHRQADVSIESPDVGRFFAQYFEILWNSSAETFVVEMDADEIAGDEPTLVPLADVPDSATYVQLLAALLPTARHSIHVSMYRISTYVGYSDSAANDILDHLIDAAGRGLEVKVLIDDCARYEDSAEANVMSAIFLWQRGVDVRLDDANQTTHTKLVIVDGHSVVLGSTNWNYYSLEKNCEVNLAMLHLPEIAAAFEDYFRWLWQSGRPLGSI